ncbi:patatin-like phospholipase family protein [Belnapia sp. T6]|uniref:Patatin-like phospholipase family protein n=1 Tax=Belnapia mucosa TaxID=2804532 RepID=A0ABS1V4C0_9PROT|nr:patatin-like phospholipase family protein [Belnapia mucosa]MBL6455539.1 patatin-like phospholipase family protein [Belnapia mucosa]
MDMQHPDHLTDAGPAPVQPRRALVLSGGIALGAFEAGAYATWEAREGGPPPWLLGASVGAVNAAIIAGNPPERRLARLRAFWDSAVLEPAPLATSLFGPPPAGVLRRGYNEASALQAMMLGHPGLFRRRLLPQAGPAAAIYDLDPLRERIADFVDFELLNHGPIRLSVAATDVETGTRIVFDTAQGARIGPEHLAASCALLPFFTPVEVEGRLLADGGLSTNAPLDLVLDAPGAGPLHCVVVELFARSGSRPQSLSAAVARAGDLAFGNQTRQALEGRAREYRLRALVGRLAAQLPPGHEREAELAGLLAGAEATIALLGYHPSEDEAGAGKVFNFSRATLAHRWEAGERAMTEALDRMAHPEQAEVLAPGLLLHAIGN